MDARTDAHHTLAHQRQAALSLTRSGVIARLADPYLTEHDRWVLGQFAAFLAGRTPGPDPRVLKARPRRSPTTIYTHVRRAGM